MKRKVKIFMVLVLSLFLLTGCGESCNDTDINNIKTAIIDNNRTEGENWTLEAETQGIDESLHEEFFAQKAEKEFQKHPKACITNVDIEDPNIDGALITKKTWKDAFKKGLIEGLLVFPTSMMLIFFTNLFGAQGAGKILSLVLVTLIVRTLTLLITFKSSMQSQKIQTIQPQLAEIQNKMKETTDANEKQRLNMKVMEIYKKNGINPLSSLLMPFVSFPIFIGVWRAVSGTLILRSGTALGVNLGLTLKEQIFSFNIWAILLFLIMGASQFISMKLPMWLAKKSKKENNSNKPPVSGNQMAMFSNIMFIMILFAGFALPAAMVIYWIIGAVFMVGQTFLMRYINAKKSKKPTKRMEKYKVIK